MMRVEVITDIKAMPDIITDNIFQTKEWLELFTNEQSTCVALFAVYLDDKLIMLQSVMLQDYIKWLPRRFGSYCVVWGNPFCESELEDLEAQKAFELLIEAIENYARSRALFIEYRHYTVDNIYVCNFIAHKYKAIKWGNVIQNISPNADIIKLFNQGKRRQVRKAIDNGVEMTTAPTIEEWRDYYLILKKLYTKIHRPLPKYSVFERILTSKIGVCCVVKYQGKVISGIAMLYSAVCGGYEWYIAGLNTEYPKLYPSTMALYTVLNYIANSGGGRFNYMGAGRLDKPYSVRDYKLTFGGDLVTEYRYKKYLIG